MEDRIKKWHSRHVRVQAYMEKDEYEKVAELAVSMGLSVSRLVKKAVLDLKRLEEEVYGKAFDAGYQFAIEEVERDGPYLFFGMEEFTVPCSVCRKPMVFSSRFRDEWEKEVKPILIKAFFNWAHTECLNGIPRKAKFKHDVLSKQSPEHQPV
jgi:hypothetical protein